MPNDVLKQLVDQARADFSAEARALADQIQKVEQSLQELRAQQQRLEESLGKRLDAIAQFEVPAPPQAAPAAPGAAMIEQVLAGVRDLITATLPEQVLEVLTEEAAKLGVRAAVFDIRGKAAWGSSARGFDGLSDKAFRAVVVQLAQDTPFRTCVETAGHVDTNAQGLKKNRNVLDKLQPGPRDSIILLPVRSAGSVSAIFYADTGGRSEPLPVDALKIYSEFAGAQLDRLMALSGGVPSAETAGAEAAPEVEAEPVAPPAPEPVAAEPIPEPVPEPAAEAPEPPMVEPEPVSVPVIGETVPVEVSAPPPSPAPAAPAVVSPGGFDVSGLSEDDQKAHRDAKRFAKLLVSEIDLYNKAKVQDGRKNADLYKRLKSDIDRSRQTYEKRFGKTVGKQYDYFHEELVRILATGDASLLGSDYPGPTV
jgi:hypothetical protein